MIRDWPLFELHTRLVRARKAGRGARLSPAEFALLVDQTEVLDQLWAKVSEELRRDGYEGEIIKRTVAADSGLTPTTHTVVEKGRAGTSVRKISLGQLASEI